jgi:hypothetical protein
MRFRQPDLHPQSWSVSAWPLDSHITDVLSTFLSLISDIPTARPVSCRHREYHRSAFLQNQHLFASFPKEFPYE